MNDDLPELNDECFFIAPIGSEATETRERSDGVLDYIVAPAVQAVGLTAVRADKIAKPGLITRQVIEHVVGARAAVVDLTDANPNVYYEMAVRHTAQLPTVLIAQEGEKLPFDIAQMRTIFFDHTSLKSAAECRDQITQHLQEALGGAVDSPIAASVSVQRLEQGTAQEQVLAQLVDGLDEVRTRLRHMDSPDRGPSLSVRAMSDFDRGFAALRRAQTTDDRDALDEAKHFLQRGLDLLISPGRYRPGVFRNERDTVRHPDSDRQAVDALRELEVAEGQRAAERQADRDTARRVERDRVDEVG